jgi:hypothetical protein
MATPKKKRVTPKKKRAASKKEVAVKDEEMQLPANVKFEEDEGGGFEEADVDSFAVPFLAILQALSPQCDEDDPKYNDEARPGMIFNSVSEECYPAANSADEHGINAIPCAFKRQFLVWSPRDEGGGLVNVLTASDGLALQADCERDEDTGRLMTPDGNILSDTRMHYCLVQYEEGGNWEPVIVGMSSTQVKKSRKWMTMMDKLKFKRQDGTKYTPAMFAHIWNLTTIGEENNKGKWKGWQIEKDSIVADPDLYAVARDFRDKVMGDQVTVSMGDDQDATEEEL